MSSCVSQSYWCSSKSYDHTSTICSLVDTSCNWQVYGNGGLQFGWHRAYRPKVFWCKGYVHTASRSYLVFHMRWRRCCWFLHPKPRWIEMIDCSSFTSIHLSGNVILPFFLSMAGKTAKRRLILTQPFTTNTKVACRMACDFCIFYKPLRLNGTSWMETQWLVMIEKRLSVRPGLPHSKFHAIHAFDQADLWG